MNLKLLNNSKIDTPAREGDAGFDIYAVSEPRIGIDISRLVLQSISHIEYDTELRVEPQYSEFLKEYRFFLLMYPRSSIIKTNLSLSNSVGVIDSGYRGNIVACFKYIMQPEDMKIVEGNTFAGKKASGIIPSVNPQRVYQKGDKIAQLIPCKHMKMNLDFVNELNESERGGASVALDYDRLLQNER